MPTRRHFVRSMLSTAGLSATSPLWMSDLCASAFAQSGAATDYKALVVVTMNGGNDGNNMLIPLEPAAYAQYAALRTSLAIPQTQCNVLNKPQAGATYGMHPSLTNLARLYNQQKALVVANIGAVRGLYTKEQLRQQQDLLPEKVGSHPGGIAQWESATVQVRPHTGWGGRIADLIADPTAPVPPTFVVSSPESIFTVGRSIQGVALQSSRGTYTPLPASISSAILAIADNDATSPNLIVAQAAKLRQTAMNQQALLFQAQTSGSTLQTPFPATSFGQQLQTIAQVINGRSLLGAKRHIFYCQQGGYDSHVAQLVPHAKNLMDFDGGVGAFYAALDEVGLADQVLLCTHSDFNRTMTANANAGSDHAWGNNQLVIGGGITGGRVVGSIPELELNGQSDWNGYGCWIPTLAISQMCAAIGAWMGLNKTQINSIFPDLSAFSSGPIALS